MNFRQQPLKSIVLKGLRKAYRSVTHPVFENPTCEFSRQVANDAIYELLTNDNPCMISRFGTGEIGIVNNYLTAHSSPVDFTEIVRLYNRQYGPPLVGYHRVPLDAA